MVELAAKCGANVVKFQTHVAEAETLENAPAPSYFKAEPRFAYFKRTAFSLLQWKELVSVAHANGLKIISSPFANEAVEILEQANIDAFKIASGEVTNVPLLERIAASGRPTILSSGMSNWAELDRAVETLRPCDDLIVMQCTTAYPCPVERAGINVIGEIAARYRLPTGFSDHTSGVAAAIAAITLGASCVEKHYTFSRYMYGSDAQFGQEPEAFERYCRECKDAWAIHANPVNKSDHSAYSDIKLVFEKSIVANRALAAGRVLSREDLAFKKPGTGIRADRLDAVVGKRLTRDVPIDHMFGDEDLQ
ncbi:MAG TPA: N-acetylneuraminate synthase family protein [Kofleriaceae bacterium]